MAIIPPGMLIHRITILIFATRKLDIPKSSYLKVLKAMKSKHDRKGAVKRPRAKWAQVRAANSFCFSEYPTAANLDDCLLGKWNL